MRRKDRVQQVAYSLGSADTLGSLASVVQESAHTAATPTLRISILVEFIETHRDSVYRERAAMRVPWWKRNRVDSYAQGCVDAASATLAVLNLAPGQDEPGGDQVEVEHILGYLHRKEERWRAIVSTGGVAT
ncbi:hypothetical protein ACFWGN_20955 [Oerskovia sp. NPDC060338]|uniref:hypothetical protein n=1 Tax=Oerskovia sp. NPDC060338 TaxID=3347100 RepID=UPI00365013DF